MENAPLLALKERALTPAPVIVKKASEPSLGVKFVTAGVAACIADLITFPLDTAKVRLQVGFLEEQLLVKSLSLGFSNMTCFYRCSGARRCQVDGRSQICTTSVLLHLNVSRTRLLSCLTCDL